MKKIIIAIMLLTTIWANGVDREKLLNLLENKKYSKLCEVFKKLQNKSKEKLELEETILSAISAFYKYDDTMENNLKNWVKNNPKCDYSHLVLGYYYNRKGWYLRGSQFTSETTQEQLANMHIYFNKAKEELNWVIKNNKNISLAYAGHFLMYGTYEELNSFYKEGLKNNPLSFYIRSLYISIMNPKYGIKKNKKENMAKKITKKLPFSEIAFIGLKDNNGQSIDYFKEIQKVIDESKKYYSKNSKLKKLQGSIEHAKADILHMQKKNKEALKHINLAIKKSPDYKRFLDLKARILWGLKKYNEAYQIYQKLISKYPYKLDYLKSYMSLSKKIKKYDEAKEAALKILKIDDKATNAWITLGEFYYGQQEFEKAYDAFLKADLYKPDSAYVNYFLGAISYWSKKDYKSAIKYLEKSKKFGEDSSELYYMLSVSYWHLKDCKFVDNAYKYRDVCNNKENCEKEKLDWAIKSADFAINRGVCKK